jgi:DNA-directed RNA polymerase subunit RPC12/RpoP
MVPPDTQVACPNCRSVVVVEPEWRLVQCPRCGHMITRMGEDTAYD